MKKKQKKSVEPMFTLPGEDSLRVEASAYAQGLNITAHMALEQISPGTPLPAAFMVHIPQEQAELDEAARQISLVHLNKNNYKGETLTNAPDLFCEHFTKAFKEGYRFGLYAFSHGYLELSYSLPVERRYELAFTFAWNRVMPEKHQEPINDSLMLNAIGKLKGIYKHYHSLS